MKVGSYEVFENVNKDNAKIILTQMRNRLCEDLHLWKSTSGMYLLMKNQIDALDIALREMRDTIESNANALEQNGYNKAIDDFKNKWDSRVKDLISWCEDCRLIGLQQADSIFDEIAEQLKGGGKE